MPNYVVSLTGYIPGVRYDGKVWTEALIEQAEHEGGPFTTIDTQPLPNPYTNGEEPTAQNFTTSKATIPTGWYRVTFRDAAGNEEVTGAVYSPARSQLSPGGTPSQLSARNDVRHQLRDGMPVGDVLPVAFNTVRLESLSDEIPAAATPTQTVFQARYDQVPTQQHMTVTAVPGTLVAYVDGSWTPTMPTVDVDANGNFTLPHAPVSQLFVSYAWQYLSDGEIDNFVEQSRRWLREFETVADIPDGLSHALTRYAAALALRALMRSANIADQKAGDTDISFSDLAKSYASQAKELEASAQEARKQFYSRGPEAEEPFAEPLTMHIDGYEPLR